MNPWANAEIKVSVNVDNNLNSLAFEDNFVPSANEGLPDSREYLDCLESRLRKLKSGAKVLQQLSDRREDCMHRLLTEGANISTDENLSLDDPINPDSAAQSLIRNIYPERQALTVGELVRIINHDYLEKDFQEDKESDSDQVDNVRMASTNKIDLTQKFFCVVSGASKGIGQAIALKLAAKFKSDSLFILLARSEKGLSETKAAILKVNPSLNVVSKIIDLSKPNCEDFRKVFIDSLQKHPLRDFDASMIVHNVGSVGDVTKKIIDLNNAGYWQDYYNLNVFGVTMLNSEFFKVINEAHKAQNDKFKTIVINITSIIGIKPFKNMGYYGSGKAAREMIFRILAEEEKDVLVLNYSPGPVKTEMIYSIIDNVGDPEMKKNFQSLRDEDKILTTDQTTSKLLDVLENGNYKSGDHVDYFD